SPFSRRTKSLNTTRSTPLLPQPALSRLRPAPSPRRAGLRLVSLEFPLTRACECREGGAGSDRSPDMSEVRFGVVGLGMGHNRSVLISKTPGARLVAVCDLDEARC